MVKINKINIKKFFFWILPLAFGIICTIQAVAAESVVYDPHDRRDPFVPLVTLTSRDSSGLVGVETVDEIVLEGIVFDPKNGSIVIVNGSVMKEGDESGNIKVIKINPDGVRLSLNGSETYKKIYTEEGKE
jgi:hypothetical protein